MPSRHVFISHATKDDEFVKELRRMLESLKLAVWVDSRNLRGGNKLKPEIDQAIEQARQVLVVLSPNTVNSPWVREEISKALKMEKKRQAEGCHVIPLLLSGIEPEALALWFDEQPMGIKVQLKTGGEPEALPNILAALGEKLPDDLQLAQTIDARPVEESVLKLVDPKIITQDGSPRGIETQQSSTTQTVIPQGKHRGIETQQSSTDTQTVIPQGKHCVTATATLVYERADKAARFRGRHASIAAPNKFMSTRESRHPQNNAHGFPLARK